MIFYGSKAINIHNGQILNVTCPNCETQTSMIFSVFSKYAHVYWIPFFPIGKVGIVECNSCKRTFEVSELSNEIKTKYDREKVKSDLKNPIWFYSGFGVIAFIVIASYFISQQTESNELKYLENPKVGDVYEFKTESGFYSSMKLQNIKGDTLYMLMNNMETNTKSGVSEIDKDINYKELYGISKKDIKNLYNEKEIYEINR